MSPGWYYGWRNGRNQTPGPVCSACRTTQTETIRLKGERTCSNCGRSRPLFEFGGIDQNGWLKAATCFRCQSAGRPKTPQLSTHNKVEARKRKAVRDTTWDGVTDREILDADWWECQMPRCLNPEGRAITEVAWPDPWSPSIDHVTPLSMGGTDTSSNKRAAHLRCNVSAGKRAGQGLGLV